MTKRGVNINKSWAVAVIATVSFFWPMVMPYQFQTEASGRLVYWPTFALSGGLMALWFWAWLASLKAKTVPAPLAVVSFLMTAFPLYIVAQQWRCLTGECFW